MGKITGPVGCYGPRYGSTIRKRVLAIKLKAKGQKCPKCYSIDTLKREAAGIWICKSCGIKFAGGAYIAQTIMGKTLLPEELKSIKGRK
ncbi:MAG: 50S ribosomal protein L37ae [Candidatus Methanomethylicia archaeon]|jgi:large subunit ribosomal protein L37Ae|uniref:Large ribosomal subunit protein eL43 n=1 Tax=Thermoproteota archaeon TaxID=2056631 RepID=A0A523BGQ5_9CREN|nr:50S ribosomal protein L37ae [Candidatus Methanomethylicia archaeon]MCQ5340919.1 50S ribosomal protein L37ae [Candidatus Methanomethylicia archaeon]NHV45670.1 50S ribosomal protein L37ae [Candidatus Verstraetearchaeota archaeon]RZN56857.1 MAG: 50S ribosomal protein L37ae [Candidatus Verstraetearchaeota archaeon]TDA40105.1 MAG: 50S ribosomal protein L37ae [Candidatus Verstraetearchaeota archaeon]